LSSRSFFVWGAVMLLSTYGACRTRGDLISGGDGGMTIYDTTLHVHWLANANLAASNSFGVPYINQNGVTNGLMTYWTALNWVQAMNASSYLNHTNWMLPFTPAMDGNATLHNMSTNFGFGYNCTGSDMGELFYTEMGGSRGVSISNLTTTNAGLFTNFQPYLYWSRTPQPPGGVSFSFGNGFQGTNLDVDLMYALPYYPDTPGGPPQAPPNRNIGSGGVVSNPDLVLSADRMTVYDRASNITWFVDANYAASHTFQLTGVNATGSMKYSTVTQWLTMFNQSNVPGAGRWRLPNSSASNGYWLVDSELGNLFYNQLQGHAGSPINTTHGSDYQYFRNLQPYLYWTQTVSTNNPGENGHSTFSFETGFQGSNFDANDLYVLPVLDGVLCRADFNGDGVVAVQDIFSFLAAWFAQNGLTGPGHTADFNNDSIVNVTDIFAFLAAWFAGCP
jgi:hypothetical protein